MTIQLINADARNIPVAYGIAQTCVTSPPYFGLRDYGTATWKDGDPNCDHQIIAPDGGERANRTSPNGRCGIYKDACGKCGAVRIDAQIGLEQTPAAYVANIVQVMREVWRVLRDDGTCWINLGDSYNGSNKGRALGEASAKQATNVGANIDKPMHVEGLKPKDLIGIPWRVAFALQDDGWYLRSDIIWHKNNPMPESVRDRPTRCHEYIFLLAKQNKYYYDADAIAEPAQDRPVDNWDKRKAAGAGSGSLEDGHNSSIAKGEGFSHTVGNGTTRNKRDVWSVNTSPYKGAHFATFPQKLIEPCILAGTSAKGCCPKCGAAWGRVSEKTGSVQRRWSTNNADGSPYNKQSSMQNTYKEIGWQPTCDCNAGDPVPCIVLDPFCGSGTTGAVALEHGRSFIGVELNLDYIKLAEQRISDVQPRLIT